MSAALLILAAGLGSRFGGGIKQLAPVGPSGEYLFEYSVYDAVRAGFDRVILVIRRDMEKDIFSLTDRCGRETELLCCVQDVGALPAGYALPAGRTKPWGTVHAVLSAERLLDRPFLIINADDYYGRQAYGDIYRFLTSPENGGRQCMGGFRLENTVSGEGKVTRGICSADSGGHLISVTETYGVYRDSRGDIRCSCSAGEGTRVLDGGETVSMNMWGCTPSVTGMLGECFEDFLKETSETGSPDTAEYALPQAFDRLIKQGRTSVSVISVRDKWYGMTYRENLPVVREAFASMTAEGKYPDPLFGPRGV